ncbi:MAG: FIST C-terminal domain-containing protein [Chthoniobacterales bacterium]|nr:FIST C-terminal domain-containing protein [Chthoniobacterales bacterium]
MNVGNPVKTQSVVVYTATEDSREAGLSLGDQIAAQLEGTPPDAVILFVSPKYDAAELVACVVDRCGAKIIIGCSSAGEFTSDTHGDGRACAIAIRSSSLQFAVGIGRGISSDRRKAAEDMVRGFRCGEEGSNEYCSALILTDALAGHADELIEELTLKTGGSHQFFGGGAGDDANFKRTQVFVGKELASDAAVALEIISEKPIGIGVRHGWSPATAPMRVTESRGAVLVSLNASPILDVFREHAETTNQKFDQADPMPFFLHNILGIETGDGYKLRVPLAVNPDGSVLCAAEIPQGAAVCIMSTDVASAKEAAANATRAALDQLNGHQPGVALFFDCVATRLRMGREFGDELEALKEVLGETQFAGCNTYGQVARTTGQFNGFHNCTAVVCVLPA